MSASNRHRSATLVAHHCFRRVSQAMEDCRGDVSWSHLAGNRIGSVGVTFAVNGSAFHAAASQGAREDAAPVIAAGVCIDLRRVAKFADPRDQSVVEHASVFEVFNQCRETLIHHRHQKVFEAGVVSFVSIPRAVVLFAFDLLPVDLNE